MGIMMSKTEKEGIAARARLRAKEDSELERRKLEVETQRWERESLLLEQERVRYNLLTQRKPLSKMVI